MREVRAYWDTQICVVPGWYCQVICNGDVINDSQKITFPVEVDDFLRADKTALAEALSEAFPEYEIYVQA